MRLRPYAPGEEGRLADLWYESWRSVGLARPVVTREQLAERTRLELSGRWTVTVAEVGEEMVGFLALALAEDRLDQLFLAPAYQGRGLGGALFEVAVRRMPTGFWLSTQAENRRARAFYEQRGMSLDRVEYDADGDRVFYVFPATGAEAVSLPAS